MGNLSPDGVVEEFQTRWSQSALTDKMPLPEVMANGRFVELTTLAVYGPHQRHGYAGRALRMLTSLCDANGIPMKLVARPLAPELGLTKGCPASFSIEQLLRFYERHGFVEVRPPGDDTREMIRQPQPIATTKRPSAEYF